jgi:hypothetical protein
VHKKHASAQKDLPKICKVSFIVIEILLTNDL